MKNETKLNNHVWPANTLNIYKNCLSNKHGIIGIRLYTYILKTKDANRGVAYLLANRHQQIPFGDLGAALQHPPFNKQFAPNPFHTFPTYLLTDASSLIKCRVSDPITLRVLPGVAAKAINSLNIIV